MILRFVLPLILILPTFSFLEDDNRTKLRDILWLQDQRDLGDERLERYLVDADGHVRMRAALACASIQDTIALPTLMRALLDSTPDVRLAAAFAIGQTAGVSGLSLKMKSEESLLQVLHSEASIRVRNRIIEALGKFASENALRRMLERGGLKREAQTRRELALTIARFAIRGIVTEEATIAVARLSEDADAEVRWRAAYAFMRIGDAKLLVPHIDRLVSLTGDENTDVRMYAASALGRTKDQRWALPVLLRLVDRERDWRVAVNAIQALSNFDSLSSEAVEVLLRRWTDPNEHISLTSIKTYGSGKQVQPARRRSTNLGEPAQSDEEAKSLLLAILINHNNQFTWRQQGEAAIALAKHFGHETFSTIRAQLNSPAPVRKKIVNALSFIPSTEALELVISEVENHDPSIAVAAIEGLLRLCRVVNVEGEVLDRIRARMVDALDRRDLALTATAASAMADSIFRWEFVAEALEEAYSRLKSPEDVEPMVAILTALGELEDRKVVSLLERALKDHDRPVGLAAAEALRKITGDDPSESVTPHTKPLYSDYDWDFLFSLKQPLVVLHTNRGDISLELLPDDAPFTVLNFLRLSGRGFYDRLTFHRVVANFVIQGGDPRGDGWGGPGYAIRSEFGLQNYDRGMVGMASAGKDTEGCQFFITHSPQPHLDGRYTIFGQVIDGMDVVDQIQVGDVLEAVVVNN